MTNTVALILASVILLLGVAAIIFRPLLIIYMLFIIGAALFIGIRNILRELNK
jgi:hypothetical protein